MSLWVEFSTDDLSKVRRELDGDGELVERRVVDRRAVATVLRQIADDVEDGHRAGHARDPRKKVGGENPELGMWTLDEDD